VRHYLKVTTEQKGRKESFKKIRAIEIEQKGKVMEDVINLRYLQIIIRSNRKTLAGFV